MRKYDFSWTCDICNKHVGNGTDHKACSKKRKQLNEARLDEQVPGAPQGITRRMQLAARARLKEKHRAQYASGSKKIRWPD